LIVKRGRENEGLNDTAQGGGQRGTKNLSRQLSRKNGGAERTGGGRREGRITREN